jgi:hypothetical protein
MQNGNSIKDIPTLHKSGLGRPNYMISHYVKSDCGDLSEYLKTNIKGTDRPILLDTLCFINLR